MSYGVDSQGLLEPLQVWLENPNVTEIMVNQPGVVWVEEAGHIVKKELPSLTVNHLMWLCRLIASENHSLFGPSSPILSAVLHHGERIEALCPPVSKWPVMAIRKQGAMILPLENYPIAKPQNHQVNLQLKKLYK